MYLNVECPNCRVAGTCPKKGSSPLTHNGKPVTCKLVGGYGRVPVDPSILSKETAEIVAKNGPCLTLVEVPLVEDGRLIFTLVKIFSQPVLSDREKISGPTGMLDPKAYND